MRTIGADIRDHEVVVLDFTDTVYMDDSAAVMASSRFVPMLPCYARRSTPELRILTRSESFVGRTTDEA